MTVSIGGLASCSKSGQITVSALPPSGNITVATNADAAKFTITGPVSRMGTGKSATFTSVPAGNYTITYSRSDCLAGFPTTETKTLAAGATIVFNGNYELGFLSFPLRRPNGGASNPCTATINSVFDHSQARPLNGDGQVVAYTGEKGMCNTSANGQDLKTRVQVGPDLILHGFRNPLEPERTFRVNGAYAGGGGRNCGDTLCDNKRGPGNLPCNVFLFYDGHPGIDYNADCSAPVYAAVSGTVHYPRRNEVPGINNAYNFHVLEIIPDPPYDNYRIFYVHLATHISVQPNQVKLCVNEPPVVREGDRVTAGVTIIGKVGSAGLSNDGSRKHLHFEVHIRNGNTSIPVDPYGWKGIIDDPYGRAINRNLWK